MQITKTKFALGALALVAIATLSTALVTARVIQASPQSQDEMEALMKKYMELATPGKPHKELVKQVGEWTFKSTFMNPQGQEQTEHGTAVCEALLGGRFIMTKQKSKWGGMPYESVHILGYDNLTKRYCSLWLDSFATGMFRSDGQANDEGVVELKGSMKDAMTPKGRPFRTVMIPKNENEYTVEIYDSMTGEEQKWGTIVYSRK